jgi:hypothetical protein
MILNPIWPASGDPRFVHRHRIKSVIGSGADSRYLPCRTRAPGANTSGPCHDAEGVYCNCSGRAHLASGLTRGSRSVRTRSRSATSFRSTCRSRKPVSLSPNDLVGSRGGAGSKPAEKPLKGPGAIAFGSSGSGRAGAESRARLWPSPSGCHLGRRRSLICRLSVQSLASVLLPDAPLGGDSIDIGET